MAANVLRCSGVNALARALPPFRPSGRPAATFRVGPGFFLLSGGDPHHLGGVSDHVGRSLPAFGSGGMGPFLDFRVQVGYQRIRYGARLLDFILIGLVAFLASALTFFSGFGLGTLLLPAFALFLPAPAAVAATAVVHLLNGLFKGALVYRTAHWPTVLKFGLPAIPGAIIGAFILGVLGEQSAFRWSAFGFQLVPSAAGVLIGAVLIIFAILEMIPWFQRLKAPPGMMPVGGAATGFFGGLTGQQGALRSIFLLRAGLEAPQYIATGVLVAILIDLARVPTYFGTFAATSDLGERDIALIALGTIAAFAGAWLGSRYLKKATVEVVRVIVATLLLVIGSALILGLIGS
ncbi:MAG: TSUP family transporter [Enhydrobacter sp.]|nr:TSUP family transporter [Enhydrobacter sp.]